jgi:hypothetical protein
MEGIVVFDNADRYGIAIAELAGYLKDGRMKSREDVVSGLDTFPKRCSSCSGARTSASSCCRSRKAEFRGARGAPRPLDFAVAHERPRTEAPTLTAFAAPRGGVSALGGARRSLLATP